MTLTDLFYRLKETGDMFNTWAIPLTVNGKEADVTFSVEGSAGNYSIDMHVEEK